MDEQLPTDQPFPNLENLVNTLSTRVLLQCPGWTLHWSPQYNNIFTRPKSKNKSLDVDMKERNVLPPHLHPVPFRAEAFLPLSYVPVLENMIDAPQQHISFLVFDGPTYPGITTSKYGCAKNTITPAFGSVLRLNRNDLII